MSIPLSAYLASGLLLKLPYKGKNIRNLIYRLNHLYFHKNPEKSPD